MQNYEAIKEISKNSINNSANAIIELMGDKYGISKGDMIWVLNGQAIEKVFFGE